MPKFCGSSLPERQSLQASPATRNWSGFTSSVSIVTPNILRWRSSTWESTFTQRFSAVFQYSAAQ